MSNSNSENSGGLSFSLLSVSLCADENARLLIPSHAYGFLRGAHFALSAHHIHNYETQAVCFSAFFIKYPLCSILGKK